MTVSYISNMPELYEYEYDSRPKLSLYEKRIVVILRLWNSIDDSNMQLNKNTLHASQKVLFNSY